MAEHDAEAQRLRAEGLLYREIANRLGLSSGTAAWKACHRDEVAVYQKARRPAIRAAERKRRAPCPRCGRPMGPGSSEPARRPAKCVRCQRELEAKRIAERDRLLERLWAEGLTRSEIAAHFGWTKNHAGVEIVYARRRGADLPYRNRGYTKYGEEAKAA